MMMDIDSPVQSPPEVENSSSSNEHNEREEDPAEKVVQIHPLVIVGMSDHYTRVMMDHLNDQVEGTTISSNDNNNDNNSDDNGGAVTNISSSTNKECKDKLMGLLFGIQDNDKKEKKKTISIVDVEEIILKNDDEDLLIASIQTKIDLHKKVFPQHFVVGWYRLGVEQLEQDLQLCLYGWIQKFQTNPLFVWMDTSTPNSSDQNNDDDDLLPLNLYDIHQNSAFVQLELNLKTFEPERIAMDAVVLSTQKPPNKKQQQQQQQTPSNTQSSSDTATNNDDNNNNNISLSSNSTNFTKNEEVPTTTMAEHQLQSIQSSMEAMNSRIAILLKFLRQTQANEIPTDYKLLREVNALIQQLSFVMNHNYSNKENALDMEYNNLMILTYLSTIAKTTKAVEQYSSKYLKIISSNNNKPKSQWATHHINTTTSNNRGNKAVPSSSTTPYGF